MRRIVQHKRFRKDIKRMTRRGKNEQKLYEAVDMLVRLGYLPTKLRPHRLVARWGGFWECHIEPDWLLIYDVSDVEVLLVRTGTHADLFE
ncbi:MAG TPA: type II toxin-antitoxin system YafQ family toxin [Candidatus Paceibacterota bacterium]|nr:type II toxin-antitoxin system YafQ family toxin [Candidatus Paceibacterota bacterium]